MTPRPTRLGGALLLALASCGHVTADDPELLDEATTTDDTPTPPDDPGPRHRFFLSEVAGAPRTDFATLDDAYLNAAGTASLAPGDYYVSIAYEVCPPGMPLDVFQPQQSPVACRTFRIGAAGTIVAGPLATAGVTCPHATGSDATSGGVTFGLMPFEIAPSACGTFIARVIPAGAPEVPTAAVANLYFTAPLPDPPAELPDGDPPPCGQQ